jgi:signal transduction histidine kinase
MVEMLDSGRVSDDERKQKYYSAMLQESERLSHLIDNILDFSKMEAGLKNFSFKEDNLAVVVEEIVMSFQHHLIDKGFQINLNLPDSIPNSVFDREAIQQVFQNLIDNACKYSGGSKIIDVEMEQVDSEITINIKDYGIGIHKDEQDKIFSQFYRAGDELTQNVKGSGIGLTIVKQIVEAHHGTIKLKSEPGKGSNFQIVLPLKMD